MRVHVTLIAAGVCLLATPVLGQQCLPAPDGLISWWQFEGTFEDTLGDNHAIGTGGASFVTGHVGGGVQLEQRGFIDVAHASNLDSETLTVAGWVRPDGPGPNDDSYGSVVFEHIYAPPPGDVAGTFMVWWRATDHRFRFAMRDIWTDAVSTNAFPPGSFYHVAFTYDGSTMRLYVDGNLEAERLIGQPLWHDATNPWTFGSTPDHWRTGAWPRTWNGVLDEIQYFNRDLTNDEIRSIYEAGSAGICSTPTYACTGFLPPMANYPVKVKGNRALPLKSNLYDAESYEMTDLELAAAPVFQVWFQSASGGDPIDVTDDALSPGMGDDGNQCYYDAGGQWHFNLKTSNFTSPGTYTVTLESGDDAEYVIAPTCETQFVIE